MKKKIYAFDTYSGQPEPTEMDYDLKGTKMIDKFKESIHQEFERFMRDEMEDNEKKSYTRYKRYKIIEVYLF